MKEYEILYIVKPNLGDDRYADLNDKFKAAIEKNGGEIVSFTPQGIKEIAATFDGLERGYYVLSQFKANPAGLDAVQNLFKVEEDMVRYLNVELSSVFPEQLEPEVKN